MEGRSHPLFVPCGCTLERETGWSLFLLLRHSSAPRTGQTEAPQWEWLFLSCRRSAERGPNEIYSNLVGVGLLWGLLPDFSHLGTLDSFENLIISKYSLRKKNPTFKKMSLGLIFSYSFRKFIDTIRGLSLEARSKILRL